MRSASSAAALILASAFVLPRIGTYLGSKSFSRSTPSSLFGRSIMWPLEATTEKPRPRNLVSVRDLVGDSTMTSDLPAADAAAFSAVLARGLRAFGALPSPLPSAAAVFRAAFFFRVARAALADPSVAPAFLREVLRVAAPVGSALPVSAVAGASGVRLVREVAI